ncbi:MAG: o-succinylbenzoate synthase [Chloroflexi bacterium]|nr:o-succinylbenzoate synthase [Chloroflexota bacterium]
MGAVLRIRRVAWATFRIPYTSAFSTAHGAEAVREGLILRLTADDGLVGLGEASPVPAVGGGTLADALSIIADLAPRLVGLDLAALDFRRAGATAVACAVDTALLDLRARAAGIVVATLLGGDGGRAVPVNATVGVVAADGAAAAARRAVLDGYACVKLKVGVAGTAAAEIDRIAAVSAAIGPGGRLRLDANGAWDVATAIAILREVERFDLELVEQPVAADDLAGMARVRESVGIPIAADESGGGPAQARQVIAAGAADVLVVKPMMAGGLRPALAVIELARVAGLGAVVTTTIDAGVGVAAALHLATAVPDPPRACGLATGPLLAGDLIVHPLSSQAGTMRIPAGLGLGVDLDEQQIARYGGVWHEVGR